MVVFGHRLDLMTSEAFSNLIGSVILWICGLTEIQQGFPEGTLSQTEELLAEIPDVQLCQRVLCGAWLETAKPGTHPEPARMGSQGC